MSCTVSHDASDNLLAQQRQITNQIQYLMADKLVRKAKRTILDAFTREHDYILFRSAAYQSHVFHRLLFMEKSKGTSGCELFVVKIAGKINLKRLFAYRKCKIDLVSDGVAVGRIGSDEFFSVAHLDFAQDLEVRPALALLL